MAVWFSDCVCYLELGLVPYDVEVGPLLSEEQGVAGPPVGLGRLLPRSQPRPDVGVVGAQTPAAPDAAPLACDTHTHTQGEEVTTSVVMER